MYDYTRARTGSREPMCIRMYAMQIYVRYPSAGISAPAHVDFTEVACVCVERLVHDAVSRLCYAD